MINFLCFEYLLTQHFLLCPGECVTRSSDGVKHGKQGPELPRLSAKVGRWVGAWEQMAFPDCTDRQNHHMLLRTKTVSWNVNEMVEFSVL